MDTIEGGEWLPDQELAWTLVTRRRRAHPRARERARLLLRPQPRRHHPPEGVRRPDLRPHGAQGRPDRHRDHQPPRRAGVGARHRPARRAPRGRARAHARRRARSPACCSIDMRTGEFVFVRAKAVLLATGGGPTMYRYHTPSGDKSLRRPGHGAARRAAAARHGDGAVPSDRPARRAAHAHDRHRARGRPARRGRLPAQRRGRALHGALRPARRARDARHRVARDVRRDARRAAPRRTAASTSRWATSGRTTCGAQFKGMVERCADCGFDLAGGRVEVVPTAHYMMGGVEFDADCTTALAGLFVGGRGHRRRARREPAGRQRRGELDGVRRDRRRVDGGMACASRRFRRARPGGDRACAGGGAAGLSIDRRATSTRSARRSTT